MTVLIVILILLAVLVASFFLFMQQKQFGKDPFGERLERLVKSPNYQRWGLSKSDADRYDAERYILPKVDLGFF